MKRVLALFLTIFSFYNLAFSQSRGNTSGTLDAGQLKPFGRYAFDAEGKLELISSAVHFGFSFTGDECTIYASLPSEGEHNYLQYTLDGIYQKRIRIEGKGNMPVTIKATSTGKHNVWIYKATEATTGLIYISKVAAPGIKPLPVAKAPLIEFIGNSITCGAAADASEYPCGTGAYHDHHNAYMAYGPRVARTLGVNFLMSSVSGIGIYRTWNMDSPSMPQVYEKLNLHEDDTRRWDFKMYTPKIVSIALGTNDLSKGDGKTPRKPFDESTFVNAYIKFVQLVKSKYPKARIALLSSPMVKGEARTTLEKCLNEVKKQIDSKYPADAPVATFFFEPMEARGCDGHPSVEDHQILAEQLTPFYKSLLK